MRVKTKAENSTIKVYSDYNRDFVAEAKNLNGKWIGEEKCWSFPVEIKDVLADKLLAIYGENGMTATENVTIEIDLDAAQKNDDVVDGKTLMYGKIALASRWAKNSNVKMQNGAMTTKGGYGQTGGSWSTPLVNADRGTCIMVTVPKSIYESLDKTGISIKAEPGVDKDALAKEKEDLLQRLAEIDKLLNA